MKIYKNHKFFGVISLIDLFILIILIGLGVAAYNRFFKYKDSEQETIQNNTTFVYTIKFGYLAQTTQNMIKVNDSVYDKISGTYIGKVVDVIVEQAKYDFVTQNGDTIIKEVPNKNDITVKIKTNGTYNNGEYLANNLIRILVGQFKSIKTKYVEMTGQILEVKLGE